MYDYAPAYGVWGERIDGFMQAGKAFEGTVEEHQLSIVPDTSAGVYNVKVDGWLVGTSSEPETILSCIIQAYEETIIEEEIEVEKEDAVEIAKAVAKEKAVDAGKDPKKVGEAILKAAMEAESADYEVDPDDIAAVVAERIEEFLSACEAV